MGYVICTTNNTDVMRTWDTKRDTSNNDLENMTCSNLRTAFVSSKILFKCPTPSQNPHVLLTFDLVHNPLCLRRFNVQKWRAHVVLCRFWLGNALRATTACNFSSLIWPAGSAPAALASLLFDPPEPQIIRKTKCFATFLPFRAPGSSFFGDFLFLIFFLLLFSSLTLPISAFHLPVLSEVWLLNFLRTYKSFFAAKKPRRQSRGRRRPKCDSWLQN